MSKELIILHEYGDRNHYQALEYLCKASKVNIEYYEFSIVRNIVKSFLKKDFKLFKKQIINIRFLINLLFSKDKKILLGIAPYDYRLIILKIFLKKHKIYYHTSWIDWSGRFFPKKLFVNLYVKKVWKTFLEKESRYIFAVSSFTKKSLLNNYNLTKNKIEVVYHSYDDKCFKFKDRNINTKFIYVGRLEKEKGIEELLSFFSRNTNYTLFIAGKGKLLEVVKNYEEKFNNIKYLGFLNKYQLANYYNQASFLLLNSKKQDFWEELFGIVIIEAMACGVIPITTDHVGPKEIIINKNNGFIFKEELYFQELQELLKLSLEEFYSIRKNALIFSKKYTVKCLSKKWERILSE